MGSRRCDLVLIAHLAILMMRRRLSLTRRVPICQGRDKDSVTYGLNIPRSYIVHQLENIQLQTLLEYGYKEYCQYITDLTSQYQFNEFTSSTDTRLLTMQCYC